MPAMLSAIRSRGPDGEGQYRHHGIYLGHTRLAVIDPANGAQPLASGDGRYVVSYNGEIYNYAELRRELESAGVRFATNCDTELIPAGYAVWGERLFGKLDGIFAFALLDTMSGRLTLVRDPLGVKPLYYALHGDTLAFASTVRAVLAHPDIDAALNPDAIRDFVQYRWLRGGTTMHDTVKVLPAAMVLVFERGSISQRRYWTPGSHAPSAPKSEGELVEAVHAEIDKSVHDQMRADVPVAVFLSGGVDSSMIAQMATRHSTSPVQAYTIDVGNQEDVDDAASLARELGMPHTLFSLQESDFDALPDVIGSMDRPVGDAVVLAAWKLCRDAAKDVKVALTGDGADELFAGYVHIPVLRKLHRLRAFAPAFRTVAPLIERVPVRVLDRFFHYDASLGHLGREAVAGLFRASGNNAALMARATQVIGDNALSFATTMSPVSHAKSELTLSALRDDMREGWLSEQILPKLDQLSMAHGLEARVPYVTTRLVDLLHNLPDDMFLNKSGNKHLLRQAAVREGVKAATTGKRAFHVPMETKWRKPMQGLIRDWLSDSEIKRHGIFREKYVNDLVKHLDRGEFLASKILMNMAALHMWMDRNA